MTNPIVISNNSNTNNNILKGGADELEKFVMENCLMLFKTQAANAAAAAAAQAADTSDLSDDMSRTFTCKTCGKKFHSFQALGGHRASHKKLRPINDTADVASLVPAKPKSHSCSICGTEFPTGQALGGHMRRHRAVVPDVSGNNKSTVTTTTDVSVENSDGNNSVKKRKIDDVFNGDVRPVLKRSNSSKRVCLDFNLSFAPWVEKKDEEDGSEIEEGEIVERKEEDEEDFLKLELRQPIRN